ncbi:MAG: ABC transporter permease, partial [Chitinophaga sp.]
MIRSYLKTAWRNLFRHKGFTATNLLGLTIGITSGILIFLWVHDELSFDRFHKNYDNVYQVYANRDFKDKIFTDRSVPFPLEPALTKEHPQIALAVATNGGNQVLSFNDKRFTRQGLSVSAHFFDLFSWEFVKGNAATAIKDPYSIVLTESSARAFFGDEDPMGKVLRVNNQDNVKVSAVVKDPPGNSSITFDYVRLFNYNTPLLQRMMNDWNSSSWAVYIQPAPGVNMAQVKKIINDEVHAHDPGGTEFITFPMSRWRLYSDFENGKSVGGMIEEVRLFSIIAVIILLIACINFMNLSTARSEKR